MRLDEWGLPPLKSDERFEQLIEALLRAQFGEHSVERYGRSGQNQHGIDIILDVEGRRVAYQVTVQQSRLKKKLSRDLRAFSGADHLSDISMFVCVLVTPRDTALQRWAHEQTQQRRKIGRCPVKLWTWE